MLFKHDLMEAIQAQGDKQDLAQATDAGRPDLLSSLYDVTGAPQNWQRFLRHVTPLMRGAASAICSYTPGDDHDRIHALYLQAPELASATPSTASAIAGEGIALQAPVSHGRHSLLPLSVLQQLATLDAPSMTTVHLQHPCLFQEHGFNQALVGVCGQHDGTLSYLAIARRSEPTFSMLDELELQQFLPHVARSLHLYRLIERLSAGVNTAVSVLDRLPIGIIFFDDQATCLSMNESGRRSINDARYLLRHMQSHILSRSKAGRDLEGGNIPQVLTLPPNLGEQHYFLVTWDILAEGQKSLHTVFFILNPEQQIQIDGQALCRLFRLTASEAKVASLIANGSHLDEVAEELDISLNTVRTHLRHIFEKTGVERQADLIHLLLRALVAIRTPQS